MSSLRLVGITLNALGAVILALRVKGILDTLVEAQHANDLNFRLLMDVLRQRPQQVPLIVGMNVQVERKQKRGIYLLVLGFGLIAVGNALVGLSLFLQNQ